MKPVLKNIFIAIIASVVSVGIVESALRIYYALNISYDVEMWKYHQKIKIQTDDLRRHFHRPNSQARLMGVDLKTNNLGFRGADINTEKISASVVMLGDSLTLGWGVPEPDTFCQKFAALKSVQCINAGVGNYNLEQIVENYRRNLIFSQAKKVFYFFYINDAEPVQPEFNSNFCIHFLSCVYIAHKWISISSEIRTEKDYFEYFKKLYDGKSWQSFTQTLDLLRETVGKDRLIVVLLPEFRNISNRPFHEVHEKITQHLKLSGVQTLDLIEFAGPTDDAQIYWVSSDDPHPNAKAHKIIADQINMQVNF